MDSHETLYLSIVLVGMQKAANFIKTVAKFSYSLFVVCIWDVLGLYIFIKKKVDR